MNWFLKSFGKQKIHYKLYADEKFIKEFLKNELSKSFIRSGRNISGKMIGNNKFLATKIFSPRIEPDILGINDIELKGVIIKESNTETKLEVSIKPHFVFISLFIGFQIISVLVLFALELKIFELTLFFLFFQFSSFLNLFLIKWSRSKLQNNFEEIINPLRTELRSDIYGEL